MVTMETALHPIVLKFLIIIIIIILKCFKFSSLCQVNP